MQCVYFIVYLDSREHISKRKNTLVRERLLCLVRCSLLVDSREHISKRKNTLYHTLYNTLYVYAVCLLYCVCMCVYASICMHSTYMYLSIHVQMYVCIAHRHVFITHIVLV